jgi:hypothetical protein
MNLSLLSYLLDASTQVTSEIDMFLSEQETNLKIMYYRDKLQAERIEQEKQELTTSELHKLEYIKYLVDTGKLVS